MSYAIKKDGTGWRAVNGQADVGPDETFSDTQPPPIVVSAWVRYQQQAQAALAESDKTILRCAENSVAVPADWAAYRKSLRAIVGSASGDATQPLPTRPACPAGT